MTPEKFEQITGILEEKLVKSIEAAKEIGRAEGRTEERVKIMAWLASNDECDPGDAVHSLVKDKAVRMNW